jgi:hypothetical protein
MCDAYEAAHSCVLVRTKKQRFLSERKTSSQPFSKEKELGDISENCLLFLQNYLR